MAEETKSGAKEFLARSGEKLALVVSAFALAAYGVIAFGMKGKDPAVPLQEASRKLRAELDRAHEEKKAPPPENWQAKAISPFATVPGPARAGDAWVASLPTVVEAVGVSKPIVKVKPYKVPSIVLGSVDVQIDHIMVNWSVKDFTREEKLKGGKEFDYGALSHVKLEREVGGTWEVLAPRQDIKLTSYKDTQIAPKTRYRYRATAYSDDKGYLERGKPDAEKGATGVADGAAGVVTSEPVTTYGLWKFGFINPFRAANSEKGQVMVKIEKFEKGVGKVEKSLMQYEGDVIGVAVPQGGGEPTSKFKVSVPGGKVIDVDFNSGATLVQIKPERLTLDVKKCKPKIGAAGREGCEEIIEKRPFSTTLIVYKDEDGDHKIYQPALPDLNEKCTEHGGKPRMTTPPKAEADDPNAPPKLSPAEERRLKREAEAVKLYEMADQALEKGDGAAARNHYLKLIKDYAQTDFVSKEKKTIIEERLASLKDKK
jgi:hypothetical protein